MSAPTVEQVTRWALEAGLHIYADGEIGPDYLGTVSDGYFKIAALAYAAGKAEEQEASAMVADLVAREIDDTNGTATYIAAAIRARGQS